MKKILITGSTDGIGKLAALRLAKAGHEVFVHGRSSTKLSQVVNEIKKLSENEKVKGFISDLSDFTSIHSFLNKLKTEVESLDVLINNAGVFKSETQFTKDNLDIRMMVNYLAPVLISNELLPLLKKGTDARIINLSSAAQAPVDLEAMAGKKSLTTNEGYAQSKLALTMWSFYQSSQEKEVAVVPVNPGSLLNTRMVKEAYGHHWSPADKGADILVNLALTIELSMYDGNYYDNDQGGIGKAHPEAYDQSAIDNLVKRTIKLIENHKVKN